MPSTSRAPADCRSACICGGDSSGNVAIGVTIGGHPFAESPIVSGGELSVAIHAGESLVLDAGEPVVWTLYVGGGAVPEGALVNYAGVDIRATTLSQSAVAVDTFATSPLFASVPITLVATSTVDSAQVATVDVSITN
jgi:hypothetical protein